LELSTSQVREAGEQAPGEPTVDLESIVGNIHFIGIGGIGMSALARLLLARGKKVSGSDKEGNPITDELASLGATIFVGHDAKNIDGAGLIVVSTAITDANPELKSARAKNIQIVHRSDVLRGLTTAKKVLAVSGTHGKTTTTGMLAQIFMDAGLEPEVVVGGIFGRIGSNSYAGKGEHFVAEADESDRTHARMSSYIAVVTNIEPDHLENYPGGMSEICDNMVSFANHASHAVVLCADDAGCRSIAGRLKSTVVTYGTKNRSPEAAYTYESIASGMRVYKSGALLGEVRMAVPGDHNKINALAAIAVASECGVPFEACSRALEGFGGVARRFQIIGTKSGITVVDDYGHHPTEVKATLQAARQYLLDKATAGKQRVVAVFQPHQPGRLRDLWNEFCVAFDDADLVLLADIYVARGGNIDGISSERFATAITNKNTKYVAGPVSNLPQQLVPHLQPGDLVLTIGAGDITKLGPELLKLL
jgi:UDP-N-acetylmuramate--alanine ligase